jgi:predicted TIM-barrel fold metal-dependent hydrolase
MFHGVFDRYPRLKLVLLESHIHWIPGLIRQLDDQFKALRREVPWCKKMPSQYFTDHIRVATQPMNATSPSDALIRDLEEVGAEDFLVFSTDYPHWDADVPNQALSMLPRAWRSKVAYENASKLYGIDVAVPAVA